jgi:prephenate dehydrogenase
MKKYQIGIIGHSEFTKLMLEWLEPYADIVVSSRSETEGDAGFGARFESLEQVLSQPVIIPSIPSQYFEEFFTKNKRLINIEALIIDICSVKVRPLKVLEELLPKTCSIIGTHPLFGPASVKKNSGIKGLKCVVCPVRVGDDILKEFESFLENQLKLKVIRKTPEEHDKEMAYAMGLSHYIGRTMKMMNIPKSELSTLAYDDLYDMKRIQGEDSWELFQSIMNENPYVAEVNRQFKLAQKDLDERLKQ